MTVAQNRLQSSNLKREVNFHLNNLTLLSLYFDQILITSATVFNVRDKYVEKIISAVISHKRTKEMLQLGVLQIVGWGGGTSSEMFGAASEYAEEVLDIRKDATVVAHLRTLFQDGNLVSRSEEMPDNDLSKKYSLRLENTAFVSNQSEMQQVADATERQFDQTGSLIAIEMLPSLNQATISQELLNTAKLELFGVTIEHMRADVPGLWVYTPFLASNFALEATNSADNAPRAFLLSPMIFGSFLSSNIDGKTFDALMKQDYGKLNALKNGDWGRFVEAYHQAVAEVSNAISLGMHLSADNFKAYDSTAWADRVVRSVESRGDEIDISTFIESLGSLGGVILSVPFLKPLAKMITVTAGDRLSTWVSDLSVQQRSQVSPFILKLEKAYLT